MTGKLPNDGNHDGMKPHKPQNMKLTQELIDKIQEAMLHTNLKGEINWKDGDDIEVQIAGTFAKINLLF